MNDINLKERTNDRIIFRKLPLALWIVGSVIFVLSIYLLSTLILGSFGVFDKEKDERYFMIELINTLIRLFCYILSKIELL